MFLGPSWDTEVKIHRYKDGKSDGNEASGGEGTRCHQEDSGKCLQERSQWLKGKTAVAGISSEGPRPPPFPQYHVDTELLRCIFIPISSDSFAWNNELTFQSPADPPAPLLRASYRRKGHGVSF